MLSTPRVSEQGIASSRHQEQLREDNVSAAAGTSAWLLFQLTVWKLTFRVSKTCKKKNSEFNQNKSAVLRVQ